METPNIVRVCKGDYSCRPYNNGLERTETDRRTGAIVKEDCLAEKNPYGNVYRGKKVYGTYSLGCIFIGVNK